MRWRMGAAVALILAGCSGPPTIGTPPTATPFSVCLVPTVDGVRDGGVNQLTLQGIRATGVSPRIMQPSSTSDYLGDVGACATARPSLVVAISADEAQAVSTVAVEVPQLRFLLVDAVPVDASGETTSLGNVEAMTFDEKNAGYLVGTLAGLMETQKVGAATHNTTAILGLNHSAAVDPYIAGYVAGARAVDPQIAIKLSYSDSADVDFCRQLGRDQIVAGADILFEVSDRCAAGYIDAAYRSGVYAIGSQVDRAGLSPAVITSAVKNIDRAVSQIMQEIVNGTFRPGTHPFGLDNEGTGYSTPSSVVPQNIIDTVEDFRAKIQSGAVTPPDTIPSI